MEITVQGWEDGTPYTASMTSVDRWRVQNSDQVSVKVSDCVISIRQKPHLLAASRAGVGACLWDSSFVLTAFLAGQDSLKWCGTRVIELGAGLGLPGIFLALQGAKVVLTDKSSTLPLLRDNVQQNGGTAPFQSQGCCSRLSVAVEELDWDSPDSRHRLEQLAATHPDYIMAADCLYIDEGGSTPGVHGFIAACATLCAAPRSCCYIAMEKRSASVLEAFFSTAKHFGFTVMEVSPSEMVLGLRAEHIMILQMHKT